MKNALLYNIQHVYIQESVQNSEASRRASELFSPEGISLFEDVPSIPEGSDPKENLILCAPKGEMLKPCPCTSYYTGCGYTVLNCIHNCPLTCTYCILQAYLNEPGMVFFAGPEQIEQELFQKVWKPRRNLRIGTGELGDSLALEHICGISRRLIERMALYTCSILELKTKTAYIEPLLDVDPRGRTVAGWSINAQYVIEHEERDTASLEERLKAASTVRDAGYMLSFHLDPVIRFPGWEKGYADMFDMLGDHIGSDKDVVWFSIGGMRFMHELKRIIDSRYPDSVVTAGEFIEGADDKKRYYKKTRALMFKKLYAYAKKVFPGTSVYFCMESEDIWREATGFYPGSRGVKDMLDAAVGF